MDWKYSINQPSLTIKSSYVDASINNYNNCKDGMIQYFYNSMLNLIVEKWESSLHASTETIASGDRVFIIPNSTYVCESEEKDNEVKILQVEKEIRSIDMGVTVLPKIKTRKSQKSRKNKKTLSNVPSIFAHRVKLTSTVQEVSDFEESVTITFLNGNIYNGPTYKKRFHGIGQFRWTDGSFYIGDFVNGQITGKGKFYFADQSTYEGEVFEGYPHGFGKRYVANSPSAYCGEWRSGLKHGQGWLIYAENDWYEGSWHADQMHGKGIRFYSSGDKYEGNFCHGKRHGNGCAIFRNNDFYSGNWNEGNRCGYGEYIWNSFFNNTLNVPVYNKYIGYWETNQMHGKGELHFGSINGSRYIGDFCKNLKHGKGIVICDNGRVIDKNLMFSNNKPIQKSDMEFSKPFGCYEGAMPDVSDADLSQFFVPTVSTKQFEINRKFSSYHFNTKVFRFPSSGIEKESMASINLCKIKFPVAPPKHCSLRLPIYVTAENIDLDPIIQTLCDLFNNNCSKKL